MQITSAASFLKNRSDNSLFFILTDMNAHHTNQLPNQLHGLKKIIRLLPENRLSADFAVHQIFEQESPLP